MWFSGVLHGVRTLPSALWWALSWGRHHNGLGVPWFTSRLVSAWAHHSSAGGTEPQPPSPGY